MNKLVYRIDNLPPGCPKFFDLPDGLERQITEAEEQLKNLKDQADVWYKNQKDYVSKLWEEYNKQGSN